MEDKVKFELVESHTTGPWGCHVCVGGSDEGDIGCVVTSGEYEGTQMCRDCLKAGKDKVDDRLRERIARLEASIARAPEEFEETLAHQRSQLARLRSLLGRMEIPTYEDLEKAEKKYEEEYLKEYARQERLRPKRKTEPRGYYRY